MTELLITLMNAPRAVQQSIALGLAVVVIAIVVTVLTALATSLSGKAEHINELRTELFRLNQIIARKPTDTSQATALVSPGALFIEGDNLPVIQAKLQERINAVASSSGAMIASISGTPQVKIDGTTYVGVRADVEGSYQAFHEVIRQLETSEPPLIIRQASIRSTNSISQGKLSEPLQLSGQIVVVGAVDPAVTLPEAGRR